MSILGTWNVTQQSIVGTTDSVWTFSQDGDRVVCDIAHNTAMGAVAKDVTVQGDEVALLLSIAKPVQTTANVTLRVSGDAFTGEGKVRFLPAARLTGQRVPAEPTGRAAPGEAAHHAGPQPQAPAPGPYASAPGTPFAAPPQAAPYSPSQVTPPQPDQPNPEQPWPGV